nr:hypothetical protein [Pantoea sp. Ap-967]
MSNCPDVADIDAQLQGRGAYRGSRVVTGLQGSLRIFSQLFGQAAMVRPKLVGHPILLAQRSKAIGKPFDFLPPVGKD